VYSSQQNPLDLTIGHEACKVLSKITLLALHGREPTGPRGSPPLSKYLGFVAQSNYQYITGYQPKKKQFTQ
jgi:hypothetical protein